MKVVNTKFKDRAFDAVNDAIKTVSTLYYESSQIYGALAKLMLETGIDEFLLTVDERKEIAEQYSVSFVKANDDEQDQTAKVYLVRHEYDSESTEQN